MTGIVGIPLPGGRARMRTDWRVVFRARGIDNVGELIVDRQRLRRHGVLSVAYQERGVSADAPSAYRVADFRLTDPRRARP